MKYKNRVKCTITNTPGTTGIYNIGTPVTGYTGFNTPDSGTGLVADYSTTVLISEGSNWAIINGSFNHLTNSISTTNYKQTSAGLDGLNNPIPISFTSAAIVSITDTSDYSLAVTNLTGNTTTSGGYIRWGGSENSAYISDPTGTLAQIGITDAYTKTEVDNLNWAWSHITTTPTTLSGYGITDALSTSATIDGGSF